MAVRRLNWQLELWLLEWRSAQSKVLWWCVWNLRCIWCYFLPFPAISCHLSMPILRESSEIGIVFALRPLWDTQDPLLDHSPILGGGLASLLRTKANTQMLCLLKDTSGSVIILTICGLWYIYGISMVRWFSIGFWFLWFCATVIRAHKNVSQSWKSWTCRWWWWQCCRGTKAWWSISWTHRF